MGEFKMEEENYFTPECLDNKTVEQLVEQGMGSFDNKTRQYIEIHLEECPYCTEFIDFLKAKPLTEEEMKKYSNITVEKLRDLMIAGYNKDADSIGNALKSLAREVPKDLEEKLLRIPEENP